MTAIHILNPLWQIMNKCNYFPSIFLSAEDYDYFGDCSTQRSATSESLHVDAPGSSHMSSHSGELRILSVHGQGEGPMAVDGHDTLFTVYKHKVWSSLSVDHSVAKSLDCGERLVCREERTVQVRNPLSNSPSKREASSVTTPAEVGTAYI